MPVLMFYEPTKNSKVVGANDTSVRNRALPEINFVVLYCYMVCVVITVRGQVGNKISAFTLEVYAGKCSAMSS
jgi:hypothetical protein